MSRGSVGAALGAAGATAYLRPDLLIEWAHRAATSGAALGKDALSSKELEQLSKMVEELSREVRNSSNTVTVVHSDTNSLRNILAFYAALAASAGALYLVVGRGWRLGDLGWVTQRAFRQGMTGLSTGIDSLSARIADVRDRLTARIAEVSRKQDEAATAAAAMRAHLADVGADVETVRNQVGQLHSTILNMDVEISDIGVNQRHALHGIYILCKAVSELSAGSSIASKGELLEYTKSPVWQRVRPSPGLEGILQENPNSNYNPSMNTNTFGGSGSGSGGGGGTSMFQGNNEPWSRQRYMLGAIDGSRNLGEGRMNSTSITNNSNISNTFRDTNNTFRHTTNATTTPAARMEESSAQFMKALPPRDSSHTRQATYRADEHVGPAGNYSDLRTGAREFTSGYGSAGGGGGAGVGSSNAAGDVRRDEQRQNFSAGRDW